MCAELWAGTAVAPARSDTPGPITVESDSLEDGPAGGGISTVVVEYLDDEGWERFGIAVLPGVAGSPVAVTQLQRTADPSVSVPVVGAPPASGVRINRVYSAAYGSGVGADDHGAGNIGTISAKIDGREQIAVSPEFNISSCGCLSVPRGRLGYLLALSLSGDDVVNARTRVFVKPLGLPRITFSVLNISTDPLPTNLPVGVKINPRGDLVFAAERSGGGQLEASATYQVLLLVDLEDRDPNEILQPPRLT